MSFPYDERYGAAEISRRVHEVAQKISGDYQEKEPIVLIAVLKGAGMFVSVLRGAESDEIVDFHFVTRFDAKGADLVVLKDVVRTGVVETYLLNQLREEGPRSIRLACLVDRPQERKSSLLTDYVLFPSEEGVLVGYGMEYRGEGGNLPFIAQVRTEGEGPFNPQTGEVRSRA